MLTLKRIATNIDGTTKEEEISQIGNSTRLAKELADQIRTAEDIREKLHVASRDQLSRSVWHPYLVQLRRDRLRGLQKQADRFGKLIRVIDNKVRKAQTVITEVAPSSESVLPPVLLIGAEVLPRKNARREEDGQGSGVFPTYPVVSGM